MERDLKKITHWILFISILTILLTFIAYAINDYISKGKLDTEKLGHFGDFIGGLVGVFLTFLATLLIFHTYKSQKKGLELNRKLFSNQQFENTFFNMLKVHQELRKEISFDIKKGNAESIYGDYQTIKGKSFFKYIQNEFKKFWKKEYDKSLPITDLINNIHKEHRYKHETHPSLIIIIIIDSGGKMVNNSIEQHLKDIIELKYPIFWKSYSNYIGDYFRNIYHILKYIYEEQSEEIKNNKSNEDGIKKKYRKYADILQSQMSYSELFFMFYNALTYTKVKKYIEEFDFIENLTVQRLLHPKHANFEGMGNIKAS